MSDWVDVVAENALANGEHLIVDVDGVDVAVFKIEERYYAIEDVCTHDGAEIASGTLEGSDIVCPRHGAKFCVKTGAVKSAPAYEDIACFPIRFQDGKVQVKDNRWD